MNVYSLILVYYHLMWICNRIIYVFIKCTSDYVGIRCTMYHIIQLTCKQCSHKHYADTAAYKVYHANTLQSTERTELPLSLSVVSDLFRVGFNGAAAYIVLPGVSKTCRARFHGALTLLHCTATTLAACILCGANPIRGTSSTFRH